MSSAARLNSVKAVLFAHWDPIGVADAAAAQNEYDTYASEILRLLDAGISRADLAACLTRAEADAMGLTPQDARAYAVAEKLTALVTRR